MVGDGAEHNGIAKADIAEIKRDGRFDRINTRFIPFRLQ